jgi:putative endonuclease
VTKQRIALGKKGEELVAYSLEQAGYVICEKNYTSKFGEIDIIASKAELLVFIEVKIRQYTSFYLSELIVPAKRKKIIKTALWYISTHQVDNMIYRFDVALLELEGTDYKINYIENAFTTEAHSR